MKRQESAMIRGQSSATDPQQSAESMTTIMHWTINPCKIPEGRPTGHVFPNGETAGCISSCLACLSDIGRKGMLADCISSSLTLPKWYLATIWQFALFISNQQVRASWLQCLHSESGQQSLIPFLSQVSTWLTVLGVVSDWISTTCFATNSSPNAILSVFLSVISNFASNRWWIFLLFIPQINQSCQSYNALLAYIILSCILQLLRLRFDIGHEIYNAPLPHLAELPMSSYLSLQFK